MRKNDIAALILIISLSLGLAYFLANSLLGGIKQSAVKVEEVEKISSTVPEPDRAIFNDTAINPSVEIKIGGSTNEQPFGQ